MNRSVPTILAVLLAGQVSPAPATMILQAYAPEKHDRFHDPADPQKAFIGDPHDWSGVGLTPRWATLISPSYFLTAAHFPPYSGSTLSFYTTNDPEETLVQRVFQPGQPIAGSDLWLGKLTTPVSTNVEFYPILALPEHSDYNELEIYTFGLSVPRASATATTVRLGRNNIDPDTIAPRTEGEPPYAVTGQTFLFDFDDPGGVGDDESYLQAGDSGGPSFVIHNGAPALVGIHWFIWEDEHDPKIVGSGDTFVPDYIADLGAAMVGEQVTLVSSVLTWNGSGDGCWDSPGHWTGGQTGETPDSTNPVVVHTNQVTVAANGNAYSLLIHDSGRLAVDPESTESTLAVVRHVEIADGTLEIAPAGTLDVGRDVTMQADSQYVCELDGPDNGLVVATGEVHLGEALRLPAARSKLRNAPPGDPQGYGDETRAVISAAGIQGTFDEVPPTVPPEPDPANHGQGHLGCGVFLTDDGPHGRGVTYDADNVLVDVLQAADGDTNGDRRIDFDDVWSILVADKYGTELPGDWTEGDFNGDTAVDFDDIWNMLATGLYGTGPYAGALPGAGSHGLVDLSHGLVDLVVTPEGLAIEAHGAAVNGYLLKSEQGILTGEPAQNLGIFRQDRDDRIGGGPFTLTGRHLLGDVIGDEFAAVDLPGDLSFTYTLEGKAGIYHGDVVVPEPGTLVMLAGGALGLLWAASGMRTVAPSHRWDIEDAPPNGRAEAF